ncbi:hypothetical protein ABBQ38_008004 [Trebouxia sp. C0009 RCD-2024]
MDLGSCRKEGSAAGAATSATTTSDLPTRLDQQDKCWKAAVEVPSLCGSTAELMRQLGDDSTPDEAPDGLLVCSVHVQVRKANCHNRWTVSELGRTPSRWLLAQPSKACKKQLSLLNARIWK